MQDTDPRWSDVDDYIVEHLIGEDPAQDACLAANLAAGLPSIDVSIAQGRMLELLARSIRAQNILEIGTLGGFSAICLARGLAADGQLVTLELEPSYAEVARQNIQNAGQGDKVEILVGAAIGSLETLLDQGGRPFDLVFVDADKENYAAYLDYAIQLARPGAMLIFDNVVRKGGVIDPDSDDPKVPGTRSLYEALKNHPNVDATAIQTVGSKKWDGFLMAVVREG
ncbi:MAG: O-methyltransferase [Parasphingorhabdus sp.]|uniref:O-methyltransferase n=1 Tax=Parasphingorhabdus sp. TaxID=2709688 RepID=UPI0032663E2F